MKAMMKTVLSARSRSYRGAPRPVLCALLVLVSISASATAQSGLPAVASPPSLVERLDSIAGAGVREDRSVGVVAAVVKGKETLLLKAYGKADGEGDVPATVDTVFPIGSDTKQFTAAAILQLRDQGKLGLDDDITKWLPDFETRGNKVTLRHLLGHTSGIVDLVEMPELRAMKLMRNPTVTRDDVYRVISRYAFAFPTGSMQTYSNSGFWLLGLIIEKASGMTYEDYVEKKIFEPLGMTRSMYCNNSESVPRRAYGHGLRNGIKPFVRVFPIVHTGTYAAGAICSTAEDLITWLQALHGGKVLTPKSYTEMMTPSKLNDGTSLRYSMGLFVGEDSRGIKFIGHDGGGFGFSSQTRWYSDAGMAVVVLTNSEPDDTTAVADNLAAAVVAPPPVRPFTGDASLLVGTYKGPGRGREMVIEVTQTPQGIAVTIDRAAAAPLHWVEAWTFRQNQALLTFRNSTSSGQGRSAGSGPATELRFDRGGGHFILKRQ
jgi:CubicO group peptidase (beta-lactamase class C family)